MRIAVVGAGGVGGYFGGRLAQAGEDVTFLARGAHLHALQTSGLKVESTDGDFLIAPAQAASDPSEIGEVDLAVVAVKAWQVPEVARSIRPMVGAASTVLPLQNGVDAASQLQAELGPAVIGGFARIVSYIVGPGHIRHAGYDPSIVLGELDNRPTERVKHIHQVLARARFATTIAPDIHAALWTKFLFVSTFGGIGALTGESADRIRSDPETRALLVKAMDEVRALAVARGINLTAASVEAALAMVDSLPPEATSSMQRDRAEGRPSELDAQNGAIVRLAREAGVDVPTHESIYRALLPLEMKARGNSNA